MTTKVPVTLIEDGTAGSLVSRDASGVGSEIVPGTSGHVLTSNGPGAVPSYQAAAGGGLNDLVDDTTPQLGGNLDINGFDIVSVSNADIDIIPNGIGNVNLGNFAFDADQTVGAGQDDYVLTYDNGTGLISLEAATGGGSSWSSVNTTATTSGSNLNILSTIPASAEEIDISIEDVSTNGASPVLIRLNGVTTGYDASTRGGAEGNVLRVDTVTDGFHLIDPAQGAAANELTGVMTLKRWGATNFWTCQGAIFRVGALVAGYDFAGNITLAGALTDLTITTVGGTQTFDNGQVRARYR